MATLEEILAEAARQFPESKALCLTYEVLSQGFQIRLDFSFLKILRVPTTFPFLGSVADVFFVV